MEGDFLFTAAVIAFMLWRFAKVLLWIVNH